MLAIKGIYDGKKIIPLEELPPDKKFKVLITLLEEIEEIENDAGIRDFSSNSDAFDFWNDKKENLYQDYLVRDKK
jgi:hypothetical protein